MSLVGGASAANPLTISNLLISNAESRSRNAASSAFSQPAWIWIRCHKACNPSNPWEANQGLSLSLVCTLACSACSACKRADRSACFVCSALTLSCACLRASSSSGTWACKASSCAVFCSAVACASLRCALSCSIFCGSGAFKDCWSLLRRSLRNSNCLLCSSILRWSAASTCMHCCTCATALRCSLARICAASKAVSCSGRVTWTCSICSDNAAA